MFRPVTPPARRQPSSAHPAHTAAREDAGNNCISEFLEQEYDRKNYNAQHGIPKWDAIKDHLDNDQSFAEWLTSTHPGVLKIPTHCPCCRNELRGSYDAKFLVRCYNKGCEIKHGCQWTQSIWKGSFFEGARGGKHKIANVISLPMACRKYKQEYGNLPWLVQR